MVSLGQQNPFLGVQGYLLDNFGVSEAAYHLRWSRLITGDIQLQYIRVNERTVGYKTDLIVDDVWPATLS